MRHLRASVRVALAASVLALVLLAAAATAAGYLVEARNQRSDRAQRLAAAAAYVKHGATQAGTTRWQQALTRELTALGLREQLTMVWPGGKRVVYAPGCADVTDALLERVEGADVLFFDGTTFADDEMIAHGLSQKTAQRMGHTAMSGPEGALKRFARAKIGRRIFIHINNSNPALIAGSPERILVEDAGWELAFDGMEVAP